MEDISYIEILDKLNLLFRPFRGYMVTIYKDCAEITLSCEGAVVPIPTDAIQHHRIEGRLA